MKNNVKKILIYAHYFYPDVASTGQILVDLCNGMKEKFDVTVICTVPSYTGVIEEKYKTQRFYEEDYNGIKVIRVRVPEFNKADKISRVKNILAYYFNSRKATRKAGKFDYVFTISQPPILGGMLGVYGKKKTGGKFIYNIQDFNPEQTIAVSYSKSKLITSMMMWFDKKSCKKSDLIIVVGHDMADTLKNRFKNKNVPKHVIINNWIDDKQIYPLKGNEKQIIEFKKKYDLEDKFIIMYSGNIGLYYDLENIIKVIKKIKPGTKSKDGREVVFAFVGAGSVLKQIQEYVENNKMSNVKFIPYQDKKDLIYSLNSADIHWCINAKGIKGVSCPSKYYGIAAIAKPVLAVLEKGTEIRDIIEKNENGLISDPEDYETLENNINKFINEIDDDELQSMGKKGYEYLIDNFTIDKSIEKYIDEIERL